MSVACSDSNLLSVRKLAGIRIRVSYEQGPQILNTRRRADTVLVEHETSELEPGLGFRKFTVTVSYYSLSFHVFVKPYKC